MRFDLKQLWLRGEPSDYDLLEITHAFSFDQLSNASELTICNYFKDLECCGKLITLDNNEYITILNKFETSKIMIRKDSFHKYCGYHKFIDDYKLISNKEKDTFAIDLEFNDTVATDISYLLNNEKYHKLSLTSEELIQKFKIIDFLQISFNYDHIK